MGEKIIHKTLREQVVSILRKRILRGEIEPGDRIIEADLAEELDISRGPVREALRQIEQEGLIVCPSNKGCSVKNLSAEDAWEIYLLRANLEILAVKLIDGIFNDKTFIDMGQIVDEMIDAANKEDLNKLAELDQDFHSLIVLEANKERLYDMWSSLNGSNIAIFYTTYNIKLTTSEKQVDNHLKILEAIETKELNKICTAIQEHYLGTPEKLFKFQNVDMKHNIKL